MLNITYAPDDSDIAERIQKDLAQANETFDTNILIVLVSPASATDKSVLKAIYDAIAQQQVVLPVMLRQTALPEPLRQMGVVDLTGGYRFETVKMALRKAVTGQDRRRRNARIGWFLLVLVMLSFVISVVSLARGYVGVPVNEFQTEAAIQDSMIETLTFPTLDPLMPRTTQDAMNFPRTVEAANTRNAPLLMMTATALPGNLQASQEAFLTVEASTLTARAVTPTPITPEETTEP
jgi:hypothetical protein